MDRRIIPIPPKYVLRHGSREMPISTCRMGLRDMNMLEP